MERGRTVVGRAHSASHRIAWGREGADARRQRLLPVLQRDAESVRHAVGERVIADDLAHIEDIAIGEAMAPHELDVSFFDFRRREREFLCVSEHGGASIVKSGRRPVGLDAGQEVVIVQQATQTAPMVHDSVATTIQLADAQRDQLAVHLAQALGATHDGFIEAEVGFEPFRVQRVDP